MTYLVMLQTWNRNFYFQPPGPSDKCNVDSASPNKLSLGSIQNVKRTRLFKFQLLFICCPYIHQNVSCIQNTWFILQLKLALDNACKLRKRVSIILLLHRPIAEQILLAQQEINSTDQRTSVNFDPCKLKAAQIIQYYTAMYVSLKRSNKNPSLYLHVWKISFRHLEFLAHNYDRETKFCALVDRFTQMGSVKSDDDAHPVFI